MKNIFLIAILWLPLSTVWGQSTVRITQLSITEGAAPTASSPQTFCSAASPTIADLSVIGDASDETPLSPTTALTSGVYYASQTTNGCESSRATVTVTAAATPTITHTSGSTNQTVNIGKKIAAINYKTTNASGATVTGLPAGVTGSWSSGLYGISGKPAATGTFNYTVTTTNSNGCTNATATGTLTVIACPNCAYWTDCRSFTMVSTVYSENSTTMNWSTANTHCQNKGSGWRLPTLDELKCMCVNKITLPGYYKGDTFYWSSSQLGAVYHYVLRFPECFSTYEKDTRYYYVKCVK